MIAAAGVAEPFPGLRPFTSQESALFFGRDEQVEELLSRLASRRFLAVVGTSGSGKSSLVRAGLIPTLEHGHLGPPGSQWVIATVSRPGIDPLRALARALGEAFRLEDSRLPAMEAELNKSSLGLTTLSRQHLGEKQRLFILVDQFEEIFRYRRQSGDEGRLKSTALVKLLLAATGQSELVSLAGEPLVYVVLTMRSDYLGKCAQFRGLPEALNDSQYLVPQMSRDQLREAIEGPVALAGAQISEVLVDRLLNDAGDDPDLLPVLQHALFRVWERSAESRVKGEPVDVPHYEDESVGGIKQALNLDAEVAFGKLANDAAKQEIARRMFQRLVEPGAEDEESRRPTRLSEIARVCRVPEAQVRDVVDVFRQRGFLTLSDEKDSFVDISHESLVRQWRRLQKWTQEEAQSASVWRRLADAALKKRTLYRGPDLAEALAWERNEAPNADWATRYNDDPVVFAEAIHFLRQSERRRQAARAGLALTVAIIVALAVTFYVLYRNAEHQKRLATSRQLAAEALQDLFLDPKSSVRKSVQASEIERSTQADDSVDRAFEQSNVEAVLKDPDNAPLSGAAFSPDGKWVLTANYWGKVWLWEVADFTSAPRGFSNDQLLHICADSFSPDSERIILSSGFGGTPSGWPEGEET